MSRGLVDKIVSLCERRGFAIEACVHGPHGSSYVYNFGPLGSELRRNFRNAWWHDVVSSKANVHGIEASAVCLLEDVTSNENNGSSSKTKESRDFEEISGNPGKRTSSMEGPETLARFVSRVPGIKLPFGVAWNRKCNVIPDNDNYLLRSCEKKVMTLQFICAENRAHDWTNYWRRERLVWWRKFANIRSNFSHNEDNSGLKPGLNSKTLIEYTFPWGKETLDSITVRSDAFQNTSDDALTGLTFNMQSSPYVIQVKTDLNKGFLAILMDAYLEKERSDSNGNVAAHTVLHLHPHLAPIKVAVVPQDPLQRDLCEVAQQLSCELREAGINSQFVSDRRTEECYVYHDEIGTPYCVTVLDTTLSNGIVTFRSRNTTLQEYMHITDILSTVKKHLGM